MKTCPAVLAFLATRTLFALGGSLTTSPKTQCYACGPQADPWFPNEQTPPCENFTETESFQVDCGEEYNHCAIGVTPKSHVVSRICSKIEAKDCETAETGSGFGLICTCAKDLCNGILFSDKLVNLKASLIQKLDSGDENTENEFSENGYETSEKPPYSEDQAAVLNQSTVTSDIDENRAIDENYLPTPAAMGDKHGPPEDDEEDSSEGSGANSNKIIVETTTTLTTTQTFKENGANVMSFSIVNFLVYTLCAIFIVNLN